jgi:hypothetical protein
LPARNAWNSWITHGNFNDSSWSENRRFPAGGEWHSPQQVFHQPHGDVDWGRPPLYSVSGVVVVGVGRLCDDVTTEAIVRTPVVTVRHRSGSDWFPK